MGSPRARVLVVLRFESGDFFLAKEGEELQVADHVAVVGANPELVELINTGPNRIEPDGAGDGLAELGAVGVEDERQGQAIDSASELLPRQINAGGDVAP